VLQRGNGLAERPAGFGTDAGSDDPLHAARTLRALDLVVTVDSMPAHLAGALGVPTWTLLQRDADWRWMEDRDDSPWYPTMRLFRQDRQGDWAPVVARVAEELRAMTGGRPLDVFPPAELDGDGDDADGQPARGGDHIVTMGESR
jgi:Glycosyltransferase family 9 (heptosyltransferase)